MSIFDSSLLHSFNINFAVEFSLHKLLIPICIILRLIKVANTPVETNVRCPVIYRGVIVIFFIKILILVFSRRRTFSSFDGSSIRIERICVLELSLPQQCASVVIIVASV